MLYTFTKGKQYMENKARCRKCGTVLLSTNSTDVEYCKCGTIWIAGGKEKALRGGVLNFLEELSTYKD